jgi:hypothetical protein
MNRHGAHPAVVKEVELRQNPQLQSEKRCHARCIEIARGTPGSDLRASNNWQPCRSVAEQVDFLVDQAGDPTISSRTWLGWLPWI